MTSPVVPLVPGPHGRNRRRQRDRREGAMLLVATITPALRQADGRLARLMFEESVRRMVGAARVQLRDSSPPPLVMGSGVLRFSIPISDASGAVLEAIPEMAERFDAWDVQVLSAASHLAALVLDMERGVSRLPAPRGELSDGAAALVGSTESMRDLRETIARVAATDFTALIEGESGTGKELVARQIHDLSRRRQGPFVAVNCAALVETLLEAELFGIEDRTATGVRGRRGKFEHADGGTLFLDEVSDLSISAQAKLLRVIQDLAVERVGGHGTHRVDIRIVAATNRSLAKMVADGLFRSDLFYRLSGVEISVPPLRARRADILELSDYFLQRHRPTRTLRLSPAVRDALTTYDWPGNVRELQRVIEAVIALARSSEAGLDDLPARLRGDYEQVLLPSLVRNDTMRAWGSRYARLVLQRCQDHKRRACEVLGISYHTLQAYLRYDVDKSPAASDDSPWQPPEHDEESEVAT